MSLVSRHDFLGVAAPRNIFCRTLIATMIYAHGLDVLLSVTRINRLSGTRRLPEPTVFAKRQSNSDTCDVAPWLTFRTSELEIHRQPSGISRTRETGDSGKMKSVHENYVRINNTPFAVEANGRQQSRSRFVVRLENICDIAPSSRFI